MDKHEKISEIFNKIKVGYVLDLGSGQGKESLLCANLGAKVDAVDNFSMKNFKPSEDIYNHSGISLFKKDIMQFLEKPSSNTYDLIIASNVLPFLGKDFFMNSLIPYTDVNLSPGGFILFTYFLADDPTIGLNRQNRTFFQKEDFTDVVGYKQEIFEYRIDDNHKPFGIHKHHMGMGLFQKLNTPPIVGKLT